MVTDPIADILTRIRNANMVKHAIVDIPATRLSNQFVEILKTEGFIHSFEVSQEKNLRYLTLNLKYIGKYRKPVIHNIERISKPGLRVYLRAKNLPIVLGDLGIAIISTSRGLMTNKKARELGIGGEVLCYIW